MQKDFNLIQLPPLQGKYSVIFLERQFLFLFYFLFRNIFYFAYYIIEEMFEEKYFIILLCKLNCVINYNVRDDYNVQIYIFLDYSTVQAMLKDILSRRYTLAIKTTILYFKS